MQLWRATAASSIPSIVKTRSRVLRAACGMPIGIKFLSARVRILAERLFFIASFGLYDEDKFVVTRVSHD